MLKVGHYHAHSARNNGHIIEKERLEHFGSVAINRVMDKYPYPTYTYTIGSRMLTIRSIFNYHILILGLNGGLLVKHKKSTMLY